MAPVMCSAGKEGESADLGVAGKKSAAVGRCLMGRIGEELIVLKVERHGIGKSICCC